MAMPELRLTAAKLYVYNPHNRDKKTLFLRSVYTTINEKVSPYDSIRSATFTNAAACELDVVSVKR